MRNLGIPRPTLSARLRSMVDSGLLERVLVYRVEPDGPIAAVINPQVQWHGEQTEPGEEGCLSIPGIQVDVDRYLYLRVGGHDDRLDLAVSAAAGGIVGNRSDALFMELRQLFGDGANLPFHVA